MAWNVEQQVKSGLGQLAWLKVAGPITNHAEAEMIAGRVEARHGLPTRLVDAPRPAEDALDRLFDGRPCRIVAQPNQPSPGRGRITTVTVEFADGSQQTVSIFSLRHARP